MFGLTETMALADCHRFQPVPTAIPIAPTTPTYSDFTQSIWKRKKQVGYIITIWAPQGTINSDPVRTLSPALIRRLDLWILYSTLDSFCICITHLAMFPAKPSALFIYILPRVWTSIDLFRLLICFFIAEMFNRGAKVSVFFHPHMCLLCKQTGFFCHISSSLDRRR